MSGESFHTPRRGCPFCGSANVEVFAHELYDSVWSVQCRNCQARGPEWRNSKRALAFWNARTEEEFRSAFNFDQNLTMKQERL